ncbi:MAG: sigma-70 region 4 domain-containing protein [Deltaproteobacteria bacterium]|nr:sigma-70 region 4 domain-containing protein [Deltaproteobacteria bacterium]
MAIVSAPICDAEGKRLVAQCLAADPAARVRFQAQFAELIYRFAAHAGASERSEPGDFYLYLFEDGRLYRRLRSYEGRAGLGPFLRGFILPDLFKQFQEMNRKRALDTVSLDSDCVREPAMVPWAAEPADAAGHNDAARSGADLLFDLSPEKRLLVKLLYVEDFELEPGDIQLLARQSRRSVREVVERIERARESVRAREIARRERMDEAESAAQWVLRYERDLRGMTNELGNVPPQSTRAARLREQQAELERKRGWRQQQRERALAESRRAMVTLRYREIAEILGVPVGSVSAQVTRVRQELLRLAAQQASSQAASPSPIGRGSE